MEYFPFLGADFPQTAQDLERTLAAMLEDPQRHAVWTAALETYRQLLNPVSGYDRRFEGPYNALMDHFIACIPQDSPLRSVLGRFLRAWLDEVMEAVYHDCVVLAPGLMEHAAPGNPIRLTKRLDPVHYSEATQAHRKQVETVVARMVTSRGVRGPDMEEESLRRLYPRAYQKVFDEKSRAGDKSPSKTEVAAEMLMSRRTLTRNLKRYNLPWPPF
jgi:hypothetical protein